MASVFDNARNLLKDLQSRASSSVGQIIPQQTFKFDYAPKVQAAQPTPNSQIVGDPSQIKINFGRPRVSPTPQPTVQPQPMPTVMPQQNNWQSKYQSIYDKVLPQKKLTKQDVQVLVTSENGKEDPVFQNTNYDKLGNPKSIDTGLLQINTPISAKEEIQRLKDPEYNINKGLSILRQRNDLLGDPVLAMASYNKGARGAVRDPKDALKRARIIYKNAGIPLPETPFTKDPEGFVNQFRDKYRSLGILLEGD